MKIALFLVLLAAGVAVVFSAVSTQCPDNGHFYGATGQTVTASTTTAYCVCLDNPPVTANCVAPFESNLNGFCVRNPVLTALVVASGESIEQKLVYIGATDEPGSADGFTQQSINTPRETVFISSDPATGSLYGLTNETVLFRYVPTTSSFTQFYTYTSFSVNPSNNEIAQATAFDFDGHYVYVATYKAVTSLASIVQVDINSITNNQVWSQVWAGTLRAPIHHINVFQDSTSHILYGVTGDSIIGINLREQSEHGGYAMIHVYSSKLTTGDTATTTNANTTSSSTAITGTTCDTLGNVYFTQAGLTSGTYAIQKILKADVGKSPAPTKTLTSKSAASVTSPVIDKYNNLYWAAGSSSDNLSGVFVCTSVTLTSPICSTSSVYKWPVATQQNGTVVTVTVSQIVYG